MSTCNVFFQPLKLKINLEPPLMLIAFLKSSKLAKLHILKLMNFYIDIFRSIHVYLLKELDIQAPSEAFIHLVTSRAQINGQ